MRRIAQTATEAMSALSSPQDGGDAVVGRFSAHAKNDADGESRKFK